MRALSLRDVHVYSFDGPQHCKNLVKSASLAQFFVLHIYIDLAPTANCRRGFVWWTFGNMLHMLRLLDKQHNVFMCSIP